MRFILTTKIESSPSENIEKQGAKGILHIFFKFLN